MSSSSLTVDQLPLELLASILENLPLPDLLRASQTCCCFLDAGNIAYSRQRLNQLETCAMEGGKTFVAARFCEVYEKLMYHFRFVLGTWKIVSTCYGGLMHVKFDGYKIVGTRYYAPAYPHLTRPLRPVKQFIIQISQSGQCQCICYRGFHGPHVSSIEQFESDGFCLKCDDTNVHFHDERDKAAYDALLRDELRAENSDSEEVNAFVLELYQQKLQTLLHEAALQCLPLTLPGHTDNVIIQPGLFKGTYSAHGLEIVLLTYNDQHEAVITKITGDPNVPAGKVTLRADLNKPVYLNDDQQRDLSMLTVENYNSAACVPSDFYPSQRTFFLPEDCIERSDLVPDTYCARYVCKGQIAMTGYINAAFVDCHWVVFDESSFGSVWIYLSSFSSYSRVCETFTQR